jgi:hypothetical protein
VSKGKINLIIKKKDKILYMVNKTSTLFPGKLDADAGTFELNNKA